MDPEDGVSTLRLQIFSLTDVAPNAMELRLPNNELLHDGTDLGCFSNGTELRCFSNECVTLRRRAAVDDATKAQPPADEAAATVAPGAEQAPTRREVVEAAKDQPPAGEAAAQVRAAATREMEQRIASGFQVAANYTDGRLLSIARRHLPWSLLLLPPPEELLALGEMRANAQLAALAERARREPHRLGEELAWLAATNPSLVELVRSNQAAFRALLEGSAATAAVADAAECRHAVAHGWPVSRAPPDVGELRVLLRWLKRDFFSWVDQPACEITGGATTLISGGAAPTPEEARWGAGRVELYRGPAGHVTRFARYNHPEMMLRTRRGRCGEWANAFGVLASAAGIEVRFNLYKICVHLFVWVQ